MGNGWMAIPLGDAANYVNGRAFKPSEWKESGLPIIRIQNLNNPNAQYNYTDSVYEEKYRVQNDELLFAWSASLGVHIWKNGDAWLNQHIFRVLPKPNVDKKFLYYSLMNVINDIIAKTHGSGMVHITKGPFLATQILLPKLKIQCLVVAKLDELLSELDKGVQTLQTIKQQLKIYRRAVLKCAFEGKLTEEWRRNTSIQSIEEIFEDISIARKNEAPSTKYEDMDGNLPIAALPNGWQWVSIDKISKGVEYGTSAKSGKKGNVIVLRMGNIQNYRITYDDLAFTSERNEIEKYSLRAGDVLFNRTNSPELVGKTAIYTGDRPAIFAGYLIRVNQISYINAKYLNYFLNSPVARQFGNKTKTDGVNQSNINGKKLSSYPFPLCSRDEQTAIVSAIDSRLSICDKLEQLVDESLQKAESLRYSILKKAFEGRLTPHEEETL